MKKSFKTLATLLSVMSLIPNLSSIRAEGESTSSSSTSSNKQIESEESKEPARKRQKLTEETEKPTKKAQKSTEKTQKPAEKTQKPVEETQKSTEKTQEPVEETYELVEEIPEPPEEPVQATIDYIERMLFDISVGCRFAYCFYPAKNDFSKHDYDLKMFAIKERSKITQQNMQKFKEIIFPTGNDMLSSDDFKVLYLMYMMRNLSRSPYPNLMPTYNIIDILCVCDNYEKISEIFESGSIYAILDKTRLDIHFYYKERYKVFHTISIEHKLGS